MTHSNRMKTVVRSIAALALVAATASFAGAATLYSAPLAWGTIGGQEMQCHASNAGNSDAAIRLQVVSEDGTVVSDSGVVVVPPHGMEILSHGGVFGGRNYCRFHVAGSARNVRASACSAQIGDGRCLATIDAY